MDRGGTYPKQIMQTTIDPKKLEALSDHLIDGGSEDYSDIRTLLSVESPAEVAAYVDALREKYPDQFSDLKVDTPDAPVAAPKSSKKKNTKTRSEKPDKTEAATSKRIVLIGENNTLTDLELVRDTDKVTAYRVKRERDLVKILIAGKPVEVDLIELREMAATNPSAVVHGKPVSKLVDLAEIAKG